jgi:hypothetical protein
MDKAPPAFCLARPDERKKAKNSLARLSDTLVGP